MTEHKLVAEKSVSAQRNSPTNVPCAISPTIAKEALDHIVSYVCVTRVHTWIVIKKCFDTTMKKKVKINTKGSRPLIWRCPPGFVWSTILNGRDSISLSSLLTRSSNTWRRFPELSWLGLKCSSGRHSNFGDTFKSIQRRKRFTSTRKAGWKLLVLKSNDLGEN